MQDTGASGKIPAASVLFPPGRRPAAQAVRALGESLGAFTVSHDPGDQCDTGTAETGRESSADWLELLVTGLTFDLAGLAPGPAHPFPQVAHRIGPAGELSEARLEAITLRPGPHLMGGGTMLPVVQSLAALAAALTELPDSAAVIWHPARCLSHAKPFRSGVKRWCAGGAFPGLGLVAVAVEPDGALLSEGLNLFVGQELRIEPELTADRNAAVRLALRLLHRLVEGGRLQAAERVIVGPDETALRLEPSANRRFVRVWKAG